MNINTQQLDKTHFLIAQGKWDRPMRQEIKFLLVWIEAGMINE